MSDAESNRRKGNPIGVFASKIAKSKAAFGANYAREGKYWVLLNSGKADMHASKNSEQIIFEGTVVRVVDPGPAAGQRFKPSTGGNETPNAAGDPFTIHFGSWQKGVEGRVKRFLLVVANMDENKIPPAINPRTGAGVSVAPGQLIDAATGQPCAAGPNAVAAVDPVEQAVDMATSPSVNALHNCVVEVSARGITTQGQAAGGKKDILALDYVRRVWAREIRECWEGLHENAKSALNAVENGKSRIDRMLEVESGQRAASGQA